MTKWERLKEKYDKAVAARKASDAMIKALQILSSNTDVAYIERGASAKPCLYLKGGFLYDTEGILELRDFLNDLFTDKPDDTAKVYPGKVGEGERIDFATTDADAPHGRCPRCKKPHGDVCTPWKDACQICGGAEHLCTVMTQSNERETRCSNCMLCQSCVEDPTIRKRPEDVAFRELMQPWNYVLQARRDRLAADHAATHPRAESNTTAGCGNCGYFPCHCLGSQ